MSENQLAAQLLLLLHSVAGEGSRTATAVLEWMEEYRRHFWPAEPSAPERKKKKKKKKDKRVAAAQPGRSGWTDLPRLARLLAGEGVTPSFVAAARAVAQHLRLDPFDASLLTIVVALDRCPRLSMLRRRLQQADEDMLRLFGMMAGAPSEEVVQRVRGSLAVSLGLLTIEVDRRGMTDLGTHWNFDCLLARGELGEEALVEAMVGSRQRPHLCPEDFTQHADVFDFLRPLLERSARERIAGINILLHGPPGTGKTEFARTLAAAAGLRLFSVGELDGEGEEPTRFDRIHALKRSHRLLERAGDAVLLFDEMEDLFVPASAKQSRAGSKIFVNRLLECNQVPTIWTTNSIAEIDAAHLRRLSFVLKMDHPSIRNRRRIIAAISAAEGMDGGDVTRLADHHPEVASIAAPAFRAAALVNSEPHHARMAAQSLLTAMRGGTPPPPPADASGIALDLYESTPCLADILARLRTTGAPADFSLLLAGPPGTGKTGFAARLASELDRPLLLKRTSNLLSRWVGGTEANIAEAFLEAREEQAVLLFDEIDGILADRSGARHSWEVTQVNELLTWMESHPLPFIATTNRIEALDPAAMRRFAFKVTLQPLSRTSARRAFRHFFAQPAPNGLDRLSNLTPGDFAAVARQLRYGAQPPPESILALLETEAAAKPGLAGRLGF
jgi:SpoVK/Ycf46/Vps4 family AAA+-type ATPase